MRWIFFYDYPESGTERVVRAFQKGLVGMGHEVDTMNVAYPHDIPPDFDVSLSNYDAAHFWNIRPYTHFADTIDIPYGVTIHHIYPNTEKMIIEKISHMSPYWVHTTDGFTEQNLGRYGVISFVTPQCVEIDATVLPPAPFKNLACIGGNGDGFKRFEVITEAARHLGIPALLHDSSAQWISKEQVTKFFGDTYIYVNACFGCGGPVPPQEALLCGRPVITTRISTMMEVVKEGINGEFFDGSGKGCAKAASKIMADYERYSLNAGQSLLNDREVSTRIFLANVEQRLENLV